MSFALAQAEMLALDLMIAGVAWEAWGHDARRAQAERMAVQLIFVGVARPNWLSIAHAEMLAL